ncbi:unnamed protein product [Ectocarpus sp. 12 AP-2014]
MATRHGGTVTLDDETPRIGTSRFLPQGMFVLYKLGLAVYFLYWAIFWRAVKDYKTGRFLTHWTWYATTSYFVFSALSAFLCWRAITVTVASGPVRDSDSAFAAPTSSRPPDRTGSPQPVPAALRYLQLALWSTACISSLIVVAIFWGALYDGDKLTTVDEQAHAFVACIMLLDQFLVAEEFKLRDILFPQAFGVIYILFNVGWYYLAPDDDRLIYIILDWENNTLVACIYAFVAILVGAPLFGLVHLGIFRLRERVYQNRLVRSPKAAAEAQAIELKESDQA